MKFHHIGEENMISYRVVMSSGGRSIAFTKRGSNYKSIWFEKDIEKRCEEMPHEEAALYI